MKKKKDSRSAIEKGRRREEPRKGLTRRGENRTKSTRDGYHAKRVLAPITPHRAKNTSNVAFDAFETQFTRRNPAHSLQKCTLKRAQIPPRFFTGKREKTERERERKLSHKNLKFREQRAQKASHKRAFSLSLSLHAYIRVKLFVPARLSAFFRHFSLRDVYLFIQGVRSFFTCNEVFSLSLF
jgi:hypothetical protein